MQAARAATEGQESILTIGRSPYADPFLTSTLLSIHLPLYPNLKVSLHSDFAPELVHSLLVGKLDMALITNPGPNRKLTTSKVSEAPIYVILPDRSPLAEKDVVTLADLADQTWILFERKAHPGVYDSILRRAEEEEIVIRDGQKVLAADDAAQLVSENLGVAFVSMAGALKVQQLGATVRPLADKELRLATTSSQRFSAGTTAPPTASFYTQSVIVNCTVNSVTATAASRKRRLEGLSRVSWKLSRTVLRGAVGGNADCLLDPKEGKPPKQPYALKLRAATSSRLQACGTRGKTRTATGCNRSPS